jgi:hypothetical protein
MNRDNGLQKLIDKAPEQELWQALQDVIANETELDDTTINRLDSRMQGFLFLQDYIDNRKARIAFARSPQHMAYLRDAAGGRNVWMSDAEFTELVEQDDGATLACFARSEKMEPHQLLYIEYKLAIHPHGRDMLATSYDALITTRKSLELRGSTRGMALIRLAKAALEGSAEIEAGFARRLRRSVVVPDGDPRALWRAYLNLKSLDRDTLRELLEVSGGSTDRPCMASGQGSRSLH